MERSGTGEGGAPVRIAWRRGDPVDAMLEREWLVANGLGGYASGTLAGVATRRYHALLVAALPHVGRVVALNRVADQLRVGGGEPVSLCGEERAGRLDMGAARHLVDVRLELGLPVWTFEVDGCTVEKRLVLPHGHNTVHVSWRVAPGGGPVGLTLRPGLHVRPHDAAVAAPLPGHVFSVSGDRYEVACGPDLPVVRLRIAGQPARFMLARERLAELMYRVERSRGYDAQGDLWSPGAFEVELADGGAVTLVASTEPWDTVEALAPEAALASEAARRERLLDAAPPPARRGPAAELVLAADAFVITPAGRPQDAARSRAVGDEPRSVIAGYHWFTDWGRDTMISLEGLTLCTGRSDEAGFILRAFAHHVRDGLIPNLFPEGDAEGLYHTADATLWLFHALDRYVVRTGDRATLRRLLPAMEAIVAAHRRGTRFGIGEDPADGLLRQGAEGYQLTWMDAKCDGWVVTPRRGKAVEINALWYNALSVFARWLGEERGDGAARPFAGAAARVRDSFNRRFWYDRGGWLYDVVDPPDVGGDDASCRPNQLLALSLPHPVLDASRWERVVEVVREKLVTPVGLRSLSRDHPDYKRSYHGDLRTRDAAYHQGTVWSWLVGPFVDAWLRVHPGDRAGARRFLSGLVEHLGDACVGSVSEVFDAEPPFAARGCIAQAWGVAELLRSLEATESDSPIAPRRGAASRRAAGLDLPP
ncbi:MAG TPA: amylo-alpha-1,6-glucosidase [Anaeromyxobacteraceae bacterium]|nr:amylo-alpha-1,6-glucosidase [Anaeromyxobacteraceae bacterium]